MRTIVIAIAAAVVGSAVFVGAQNRQAPVYRFGPSVSMQVKQGETRGNETSVKGLTLTIGDVVITADDATVDRNGEFRLGSNARVRVPLK